MKLITVFFALCLLATVQLIPKPLTPMSPEASKTCQLVLVNVFFNEEVSPPAQDMPDIAKCILMQKMVLLSTPAGDVTRFEELTEVFANNTGLTSILPGVFENLTALEILHLENNTIKGLLNGTFKSLRNLKVLDLSRNSIAFTTSDTFSGLFNLKVLNLSHNSLTSFNPDSFSSLSALEVLDLTYNRLTTIQNIFSTALSKLIMLNFQGNLLNNINENLLFSNLTNSQEMYLKDNFILNVTIVVLENSTVIDFDHLSCLLISARLENKSLVILWFKSKTILQSNHDNSCKILFHVMHTLIGFDLITCCFVMIVLLFTTTFTKKAKSRTVLAIKIVKKGKSSLPNIV